MENMPTRPLLTALILAALAIPACRKTDQPPDLGPIMSEDTAQTNRLESAIRADPFFAKMPKERQEAVLREVTWAWMDWSEPSLTPEETSFLVKKGVYKKPYWPGYKSFQGENGIVVLVPERLLQDGGFEPDEIPADATGQRR